jgi:DNA modification methylase
MGISYFMDMLSSADDLIFDPIVGMGDVLKVAKSLNRRAIGIEVASE